jgi:hypothetical protein
LHPFCSVNHASLIYKKFRTILEYTVSRYPTTNYDEETRQRRFETGLMKRESAGLLKADNMSVFGWELGEHTPSPACRRKIIDGQGGKP